MRYQHLFSAPNNLYSGIKAHISLAAKTGLSLALICSISVMLLGPAASSRAADTAGTADSLRLSIIDKVKSIDSLDKLIRVAEILDEDKQPLVQQSVQLEVKEAPVYAGPYTSLIIDARGTGVQRGISPKILKQDGSEVWGTLPVTPDYAIEVGIAGFVKQLADARHNRRCGEKPLIIKASGFAVKDGTRQPCVSDEDASLILAENAKSKFANAFNVIFIIDK